MAAKKLKSARNIAITVLNRIDLHSNYASVLLNELLCQTDQKQRATDLVYGTIRNTKAIDMVISKFADCPIDRIPAKILNIIRIGAYELIYSYKTAQYSIVDEAVENTKIIAGKKQAGFVNAVLRQITRHIKTRQISLSEAHAQSTLPQTLSTGCEFDTAILPDPQTLPVDYLSIVFSLPKWLIADWLNNFDLEQTQQICFACCRKPSIYIRPNGLKTTAKDLAENLAREKVESEIIDGSILRLTAVTVTKLPGFTEGFFSVQDLTAWQVIKELKPQADWKILDLCAAPGGKTTQLAEQTSDKAKIIATDINPQRLQLLKDNISRLRFKNVRTIAYEQVEQKAAQLGLFDAVVLDVPCSNTGVLSKRPEVRYRINPKAVINLAKTQLQLLETARLMIKPKGRICYSTCSIQRQENTQLIKKFLEKNTGFELLSEKLTLPSAQNPDHDGGYIAIITGR